MKIQHIGRRAALLGALAFGLTLAAPRETAALNFYKWEQLPDTNNGWDMLVTSPRVMADDWLCNFTGPVTDFHVWGSWLNDNHGLITNLHVSIHSDLAAGTFGTNYSRPGTLLWARDFAAGQYVESLYTNLPPPQVEFFGDALTRVTAGTDTNIWLYTMVVPENEAFMQNSGTIYWLDVEAQVNGGQFGWKTSTNGFQDAAVVWDPNLLKWTNTTYWFGPYEGQKIDMAFAITTVPEPGGFALLAGGIGALAALRRRFKK